MFRKIIKKLNNFKFTATLVAIISSLAALYSLGSIFLYHFAGEIDPDSKGLNRFVGFSKLPNGAVLGMILFFAAIISLFISIYIAYSMVPFIKNSEKLSPRRGLLLAGTVGAGFQLVLVIFMILLLVKDTPLTKVGIILTLPFGILLTIATGLYIIPYLKCDFYMPEILNKEPTKEEKLASLKKKNYAALICACVLAVFFPLIAILTQVLWLILIFYGLVLLLILFVISNKHKESELK